MLPIKAVAGVNTFRKSSVNYELSDLCDAWVQDTTRNNENALHILIKSSLKGTSASTTPSRSPSNAQLIFASWLVDHGCSVMDGNVVGYSDLCRQVNCSFLEEFLDRYNNYPILRPPFKLRGYSYLNISFDLMAAMDSK